MNYTLLLNVTTDTIDELYSVAHVEAGKKDRSTIDVEKTNKGVQFNVTASDSTALRASLNTVLKTLSIFEKTKTLVHENGRRQRNGTKDCTASDV